MTDKQDIKEFKTIIDVVILFLFSGYTSWKELNYFLFAETIEGKITSTAIVTNQGRRGREYETLRVRFNYKDEQESAEGYTDMAIDWEAPQDKKIEIQFHAGKPHTARLSGTGRVWPILFFLASSGWMGYELFKLSRELKDADWM